MNWIESDWFLIDVYPTRFRMFFGLVRVGLETDSRMASNNQIGFNSNAKLFPRYDHSRKFIQHFIRNLDEVLHYSMQNFEKICIF